MTVSLNVKCYNFFGLHPGFPLSCLLKIPGLFWDFWDSRNIFPGPCQASNVSI